MIWLKRVLLGVLVLVLTAAVIEGLTSWGLLAYDMATLPARPEKRTFIRYDADLGWSPEPGCRLDDLFGAGNHVTIDDRGRRKTPASTTEPSARVICSGDSFTFGYGVDDSEAWPALLAAMEPRIAVTNLAVSGYGLDQAYLRYLRDGRSLEHEIHIFAVIREDFARMQYRSFNGYPKPVVIDRGGALTPDNVPVPKDAFQTSSAARRGRLLRDLRVVEAANRLKRDGPVGDFAFEAKDAITIAVRAVGEMAESIRKRGGVLVFVMLPMSDFRLRVFDAIRTSVLGEIEKTGAVTVDLVRTLRDYPVASTDSFFLDEQHAKAYPGIEGHFTAAGGRFVAEQLAELLRKHPKLAPLLR